MKRIIVSSLMTSIVRIERAGILIIFPAIGRLLFMRVLPPPFPLASPRPFAPTMANGDIALVYVVHVGGEDEDDAMYFTTEDLGAPTRRTSGSSGGSLRDPALHVRAALGGTPRAGWSSTSGERLAARGPSARSRSPRRLAAGVISSSASGGAAR